MSKHKIIPVIMSGGSGTRLWPASRAAHPKQMLPLVTENTMVQDTALRLSGKNDQVEFGRIMTVCNQAHADMISEQLMEAGLDEPDVLVEPMGRDTAPCAAAAALKIARENPGALMLLSPADHHIEKTESFREAIAKAAPLAAEGYLVTFGITPESPHTGFGYIKRGDSISDGAFKVAQFAEKPDLATAKSYVNDGGYSWNAGIFLFSAEGLIAEMKKLCPEIIEACDAALTEGKTKGRQTLLDADAFEKATKKSIDYAVMEPTDKAAVVPADIGWSDIGSWSALWEMTDGDDAGNVTSGDTIVIDGENNLIQSDGPYVAAIGVEDLVIVVKDNAVLVSRRDRVQDVKKIVNELKEKGRSDLL